MRPRTIHDPAHADAVLAAAGRDRRVLPRWGINSPVRHQPHNPRDLAGRHAWIDRDHWRSITVPIVYAVHLKIMRRHRIRLATLLRWADAKSLYAHDGDPGRVIVRPSTIAGLMNCDERTVQRCNAAARQCGLEHLLVAGRMLTLEESTAARKAGSPQRGLASVVALCTPADMVRNAVDNTHRRLTHVTPTSGTHLLQKSSEDPAFTSATATEQTHQPGSRPPLHGDPRLRGGPQPTPSRPHASSGTRSRLNPSLKRRRERRNDIGYPLAVELTRRIPWLRQCQPGRIAPQLNRFARADLPLGYGWTATRLTLAMDQINIRLNYNSPTRPKSAPWGLLAWYLRQIDPIADSPAPGPLVPYAHPAAT